MRNGVEVKVLLKVFDYLSFDDNDILRLNEIITPMMM